MEKDYFLDRPNEIMYRNNVPNGTKVFICTKQMQPYAKELKDLNLITVTGNLTSTYLHSRGQKVQGVEITTDKYGNHILDSSGNLITKETKGRCTYIVSPDETAILTKDGYKYLTSYSDKDGNNKFKILTEEQIIGKYKLAAIFKLDPEFEFRIPICKYIYFNNLDELSNFAKSLKIDNPILHNGFITMNLNENTIKIQDITADYGIDKHIKISNDSFLEHLSNNYQSINNTVYKFNKQYKLSFSHFVAEQY